MGKNHGTQISQKMWKRKDLEELVPLQKREIGKEIVKDKKNGKQLSLL